MENLRGIILMVASMAAFALEDMLVKRVSADLALGQILAVIGAGGALFFALLCLRRRLSLTARVLWRGPVLLRNFAELIGTFGFVSGIVLIPLSTAISIFQATPLIVTLGAALFFNERVGWRRWSAIAVGFAGMLLILRPGMAGFEPAALFAVLGTVGLAARDLATRAVPRAVSNLQLASYGFFTLVPLGLAMMLLIEAPRPVGPSQALQLGGALVMGVAGYYAITAAMRLGEISVITPFRYTRLLFALIIGILVFSERPDLPTLAGATLILGSGLYTLARERALFRRRIER